MGLHQLGSAHLGRVIFSLGDISGRQVGGRINSHAYMAGCCEVQVLCSSSFHVLVAFATPIVIRKIETHSQHREDLLTHSCTHIPILH